MRWFCFVSLSILFYFAKRKLQGFPPNFVQLEIFSFCCPIAHKKHHKADIRWGMRRGDLLLPDGLLAGLLPLRLLPLEPRLRLPQRQLGLSLPRPLRPHLRIPHKGKDEKRGTGKGGFESAPSRQRMQFSYFKKTGQEFQKRGPIIRSLI